MGEFDLIDKYFKRPVTRNALGIGDDCALLEPAARCSSAATDRSIK
jgi:thiamine-monophosphate kinase